MTTPCPTSDPALGRILLALARQAIADKLGQTAPPIPPSEPSIDARLAERGASFVTLTLHGQLRGCIGSLKPHRALRDDVIDNAIAAGWRDPRFAPLSLQEYPALEIEVSVLSPFEFLDCKDEADCLSKLRPGVDGVILFDGCGRQATFLPQVWSQLPKPADFIAALKRKAGIDPRSWGPAMMVATYTVDKFHESGEPEQPAAS